MSVYVDPLLKHGGSSTFRWTTSCHLYADTVEELHAFAKRIGMKREWFQDHWSTAHYDLTEPRRKRAVELGAIEHTIREMVTFMREQRALRRPVLLEGEKDVPSALRSTDKEPRQTKVSPASNAGGSQMHTPRRKEKIERKPTRK